MENPSSAPTTQSLVRLLALALAALSAWDFLNRGIEVFLNFDPNYFSHHLATILPRPVAGWIISAIVFFASRPISRWMDGASDHD